MVEQADRPAAAFVVTLPVVLGVYAAFQFAFDGRVDVVESVTFAVVFAAVLVGVARLRRRRTG